MITRGRSCKITWYNSSPYKYASTLSEAKVKCWRDEACIGFYYDGGYLATKKYQQCAAPLETFASNRAPIIYTKNGKCVERSSYINYMQAFFHVKLTRIHYNLYDFIKGAPTTTSTTIATTSTITNTTGKGINNATVRNKTWPQIIDTKFLDSTLSKYSHLDVCFWRQTGGCSWAGPREPQFDKGCDTVIASGHSGYCECANGTVGMKKECKAGKFKTCQAACSGADISLK